MKMDIIRADYAKLEDIAKVFEQESERVKAVRESLDRHLQTLRNGGWVSDAATAFYIEMDDDVIPAVERLREALAQGSSTTREIIRILREAEEEAAQQLKTADGAELVDAVTPVPGVFIPPDEQYVSLKPTARFRPPAAQTRDPNAPPLYALPDVRQDELVVLFAQYENVLPNDIVEKYITNPEMMAHQIYVMERMIEHVNSGGAPLTAEELYEFTLESTGDSGTALIVAHNIAKAMARGYSPIPWVILDDRRSAMSVTYSLDGQEYTFDLTNVHPDAQITNHFGEYSAFYLMLSPQQFGTHDVGDFYHYFVTAAAAYYGASGQIPNTPAGQGPALDQNVSTNQAVDGLMDDMQSLQNNSTTGNTNAFRGWSYANALSFAEGSAYGADYSGTQEETSRESEIHRQGALFGLQLADAEVDSGWRWYVPVSGNWSLGQLFHVGASWRMTVGDDTYQTLNPDGTPAE